MPHNIPEFFIIGAPKCGTTTLYHWLKSHPDIFMPEAKEPHYFAPNLSDRYCRVREEKDYLNLFESAKPDQKCGEASVLYGFYPSSIEAILEFNPNAKFIFMLRNPLDMIVSYHGQLLLNLEEDVTEFERAWALSDERQKGHHIPKTSTDPELLRYKYIVHLGRHLKAIKDIVPESQLKILTLDDLKHNKEEIVKELFDFIGVRADFTPAFETHNEASALRSSKLQALAQTDNKFILWLKNIMKKMGLSPADLLAALNKKPRVKKEISQALAQEILDHCKEDIALMSALTGRDLSKWAHKPQN